MTNATLRTALTAVALLWGSSALAQSFDANILKAYTSAGYDDVEISRQGGQIFVTAEKDGTDYRFSVNRETGASTLLGQARDDDQDDAADADDDKDEARGGSDDSDENDDNDNDDGDDDRGGNDDTDNDDDNDSGGDDSGGDDDRGGDDD